MSKNDDAAQTARCCGSPLSCGAHDPARYRPECVWPAPPSCRAASEFQPKPGWLATDIARADARLREWGIIKYV